ncbi:hypothetical protein [uncultured Methanobrevibacter sp.]|uniref:hypothetical protein n=1 Tax=uncultured Methanobrevibacter sp. TaxID=253161 RepID=UPI00260EA5C9
MFKKMVDKKVLIIAFLIMLFLAIPSSFAEDSSNVDLDYSVDSTADSSVDSIVDSTMASTADSSVDSFNIGVSSDLALEDSVYSSDLSSLNDSNYAKDSESSDLDVDLKANGNNYLSSSNLNEGAFWTVESTGNNYSDLASAVNAAASDDVIVSASPIVETVSNSIDIVKNLTIKSNALDVILIYGNGTVFNVYDTATLNLENLIFKNASSGPGGFIKLSNAHLMADNCEFGDSSYNVIFATSSSILIKNSRFYNIISSEYDRGLAVYAYSYSSIEIVNSSFNNIKNELDGSLGGAISCEYYSNLTVRDSSFNNTLGYYGSAISVYNNNRKANIYNSNFTNGFSNYRGGFISTALSSTMTVTNSTFINGTSIDCGGAIDNEGGKLSLSNSLFENNRIASSLDSGKMGGAIFTSQDADINYNIFLNNSDSRESHISNDIFVEGYPYSVLHRAIVDIDNNYWASNDNPNGLGKFNSNVTTDKWIILNASIDENPVQGESSQISFDLCKCVNGENITALNHYFHDFSLNISSSIGELGSHSIDLSYGQQNSIDYISNLVSLDTISLIYGDETLLELNIAIEPASLNTIFVSLNGSDVSGDGSEDNPYRSIKKALANVNSIKNVIYIKEGTYFENGLIIDKSVSIIGDENAIIDAKGYSNIFNVSRDIELILNRISLSNASVLPGDALIYTKSKVIFNDLKILDVDGTIIYNDGAKLDVIVKFIDGASQIALKGTEVSINARVTTKEGFSIAGGTVYFSLNGVYNGTALLGDNGLATYTFNLSEDYVDYVVSGSYSGSDLETVIDGRLRSIQYNWIIGNSTFETLAQAVEAAQDEDTIYGLPGYHEIISNISVDGKNIRIAVLSNPSDLLGLNYFGLTNSETKLLNARVNAPLVSGSGANLLNARVNAPLVSGSGANPLKTIVLDGNNQSTFFTVSKYSKLELIGISLINGFTEDDGGIFVEGELNIINCTFENSTAFRGAAIAADSDSIVNVNNTKFVAMKNTYNGYGSAIWLYKSQMILDNCEFISNVADRYGTIYSQSNITVLNSKFINNSAEDYCAGIYGQGASGSLASRYFTIIENTSFINSTVTTAYGAGAAAIVKNYVTLIVNNSYFENNRIIQQNNGRSAGAIYSFANNAYSNITNSIFKENYAFVGSGIGAGAILIVNGTVNNNIFISNEIDTIAANKSSSANDIVYKNSSVNIDNNYFSSNAPLLSTYDSINNLNGSLAKSWIVVDLSINDTEFTFEKSYQLSVQFKSFNGTDLEDIPDWIPQIELELTALNGYLNQTKVNISNNSSFVSYIPNSIGEDIVSIADVSLNITIESKTSYVLVSNLREIDIAYGENAELNIDVLDNSGNLSSDLDGKIILVSYAVAGNDYELELAINGSSAVLNTADLEALAPGISVILSCNLSDDEISLTGIDIALNINKINSTLDFALNGSALYVYLSDGENPISGGNISFTYSNQTLSNLTDENGIAVFDCEGLIGLIDYEIRFNPETDSSYNGALINGSLTFSSKTKILIDYDDECIILKLVDSRNNPLKDSKLICIINGIQSECFTDEDGTAIIDDIQFESIPSSDESAIISGKLNLEVYYGGSLDNIYLASEAFAVIIVENRSSVIDHDVFISLIPNGTIELDEDSGVLSISLKDLDNNPISNGAVQVIINGIGSNLTLDDNGRANIAVEGNSSVIVKYIDENGLELRASIKIKEYNNAIEVPVEISVEIPLELKQTDLVLSLDNISYGDNLTVDLILTQSFAPLDGEIMVFADGKYYNISARDGRASLQIPDLRAGDYAIFAVYEGNENYASSYAIGELKVSKIAAGFVFENMSTTSFNPNIEGRIGEYFNAVLVDGFGNPLAGRNVSVGFNGHVYNYITNETGGFRVQVNLRVAGGYTFAMYFAGDENYNASFAVAKITVNPQTPKLTVSSKTYKASVKGKTLTASLRSIYGSPISGKLVSFIVNGKHYTGKTNSMGIATVKISLNKKGTYGFTVKFDGDDCYKAITKKAKLIIK